MLALTRTDSGNEDFIALVRLLDADLAIRDGKDHAFYAQFNKIDAIKHAVVAYSDGMPAGCGALKYFAGETAEIKRMFVHPQFRGQGIAASILKELEGWARELAFEQLILETGKAQLEAIGLYTKSGYERMPNYGQYENVENSLCLKKSLLDK